MLRMYRQMRGTVESSLAVKQLWKGGGGTAMDIGAVGEGNCWMCNKPGYQARHCWNKGKGKGDGKDKGKDNGKGKGEGEDNGKDKGKGYGGYG